MFGVPDYDVFYVHVGLLYSGVHSGIGDWELSSLLEQPERHAALCWIMVAGLSSVVLTCAQLWLLSSVAHYSNCIPLYA